MFFTIIIQHRINKYCILCQVKGAKDPYSKKIYVYVMMYIYMCICIYICIFLHQHRVDISIVGMLLTT